MPQSFYSIIGLAETATLIFISISALWLALGIIQLVRNRLRQMELTEPKIKIQQGIFFLVIFLFLEMVVFYFNNISKPPGACFVENNTIGNIISCVQDNTSEYFHNN